MSSRRSSIGQSASSAPAWLSLSRLASKAAAISGTTSRSKRPLGMPIFSPSSDFATSGAGGSPAMMASARAQSATEAASGPIESRLGASGKAPSSGTRRAVGLSRPARSAPPGCAPSRRCPSRSRCRSCPRRPRPPRPTTSRRTQAAIRCVARHRVVRIETDRGKCELGHVGLADDDAAGLAQPAHRRGVGHRRRGSAADDRARQRRLARHVEQILDRNDAAIERAESCLPAGAHRQRRPRRGRFPDRGSCRSVPSPGALRGAQGWSRVAFWSGCVTRRTCGSLRKTGWFS